MTREELLERIGDIRDELEELADDAESIDAEGKNAQHGVFKMSFADVKRMLSAGMVDLFHIGDQVVNQHELFGAVVWDVIGINVDMPASGADVPTLTLLMHDVIDGRFVYDKESEGFPYGHAHYPSSSIRNVLNTDVLNGFSEADRAAMLEVEHTQSIQKAASLKPRLTSCSCCPVRKSASLLVNMCALKAQHIRSSRMTKAGKSRTRQAVPVTGGCVRRTPASRALRVSWTLRARGTAVTPTMVTARRRLV